MRRMLIIIKREVYEIILWGLFFIFGILMGILIGWSSFLAVVFFLIIIGINYIQRGESGYNG